MSSSIQNSRELVNQPPDTALKQQRMKAWNPILDPVYVIVGLFIIGAAFVPTGFELINISNKVIEIKKTYDSYYEEKIDSTLDCSIEGYNENKACTIEFEIEKDMDAPILVYYEIDNFYQNHREYTTSRDDEQVSLFVLVAVFFKSCSFHCFGRIFECNFVFLKIDIFSSFMVPKHNLYLQAKIVHQWIN